MWIDIVEILILMHPVQPLEMDPVAITIFLTLLHVSILPLRKTEGKDSSVFMHIIRFSFS